MDNFFTAFICFWTTCTSVQEPITTNTPHRAYMYLLEDVDKEEPRAIDMGLYENYSACQERIGELLEQSIYVDGDCI